MLFHVQRLMLYTVSRLTGRAVRRQAEVDVARSKCQFDRNLLAGTFAFVGSAAGPTNDPL